MQQTRSASVYATSTALMIPCVYRAVYIIKITDKVICNMPCPLFSRDNSAPLLFPFDVCECARTPARESLRYIQSRGAITAGLCRTCFNHGRKQSVDFGRRRSGRRLPSHEKAVPDYIADTSSLFCSGGRKSPIFPGSMSDQHHHSPGGGQQ